MGTGLSEKGMWRKLAHEHPGQMFGTSSEAGEKPSLQERKETGDMRTVRGRELTIPPPAWWVPSQGPSAEQTAANTD